VNQLVDDSTIAESPHLQQNVDPIWQAVSGYGLDDASLRVHHADTTPI